MNRQIGCIVMLGILGLLALGLMAGYGAQKNPRIWVRARIERDAPVTLLAYEPIPSPDPFKKGLRVAVRAHAGTPAPAAEIAEKVGLATVAAFKEPDAPYLDFTRLVVEVEGTAPAEFQRFDLERRAARLAYEKERARRLAAPTPKAAPVPAK